jgi:hypothetical protein
MALTFLAGLFAGAGINMLTSSATGESSASASAIAVDAVAWIVAAALLTAAAQRVDSAEREASKRLQDPNLSEEVKRDERENQLNQVATTTVVLLALTLLSAVLAILLIPGLVPWPGTTEPAPSTPSAAPRSFTSTTPRG